MINKDSLLGLLAALEENSNLFSLRQSKRAKRLIFRVSIRNGLEIVLPRLYEERWVLEAITKSKPKIEKSLAEIKEARSELKPIFIDLPATESSWEIVYRGMQDGNTNIITERSRNLEVPEKPDDVFWVPLMLQEWLQEKALRYLPTHLDSVSIKLKLSYNKVRIKRQKTRWGSCSIGKNINLNRNLMFMPSEVVDYVVHHELVHLKVLNHSPKFWKELGRSFPNYKNSINQLKYLGGKIPEWALV